MMVMMMISSSGGGNHDSEMWTPVNGYYLLP